MRRAVTVTLAFLAVACLPCFQAAADPSGAQDGWRGRQRLILIDPGHGGVDRGVSEGTGPDEKTITLAVARTLATAMSERGYAVRLTRNSDERQDLRSRLAAVTRVHPDLFISLHVNDNSDPSVGGAVIYIYPRQGESGTAGEACDADAAAPADAHNVFACSRLLAEKLTARLSGVTDMIAQGAVRSAHLTVLAAPEVPSVLLEMGFLSNRADATRMNSAAWRASLSEAIVNSVDDYFREGQHKAR